MLPLHVPVPFAAANVVAVIGCSPLVGSAAKAIRTVTAVIPLGSGFGAATTSTRVIVAVVTFL